MAPPPQTPKFDARAFPDAPKWLAKLLELLQPFFRSTNAALTRGLTLRENHAAVVKDGILLTTGAARGGSLVLPSGTRPAASAQLRGHLWLNTGGSGVADTVSVCRKQADGTFSWADL